MGSSVISTFTDLYSQAEVKPQCMQNPICHSLCFLSLPSLYFLSLETGPWRGEERAVHFPGLYCVSLLEIAFSFAFSLLPHLGF